MMLFSVRELELEDRQSRLEAQLRDRIASEGNTLLTSDILQSCALYCPLISKGHSATTRGNPYKLFVNHCRINVRKHFFSERIIKVWNSLPPSIVSFKSFRNSLNNVSLGIYTKY